MKRAYAPRQRPMEYENSEERKKNNDNTNHIQLRIEYKNKNVWIVNGRRMQMG